jgi:hypothetical protein
MYISIILFDNFRDFATTREILKRRDDYLPDGVLSVRVTGKLCDLSSTLGPRPCENPRNEVGMVGLINQGATCYMNRLERASSWLYHHDNLPFYTF